MNNSIYYCKSLGSLVLGARKFRGKFFTVRYTEQNGFRYVTMKSDLVYIGELNEQL